MHFHRFACVATLALAGCCTPDTQPVIETLSKVETLAAADTAQHRKLIQLAAFDTEADRVAYLTILDDQEAQRQRLLEELALWAEKVGSVDPLDFEAILDQLQAWRQR